MIHVAIVDDEEEQIETTRGLLLRYEKEHDTAIRSRSRQLKTEMFPLEEQIRKTSIKRY